MNKWFRFHAIGFRTGGMVGSTVNVIAPTIRELRKTVARRMVATNLTEFVSGSVDRVVVSLDGDVPKEIGLIKSRALDLQRLVREVKESEFYKKLREEKFYTY